MSKRKLNADDIKQSVNPADFYRHELNVPLKKHGWQDGGLCPFHSDNKQGSFFVNLETGAYKCFACVANGGDIISFTMALHGLRFAEALAQLAHDWGI
ncbi:MAG: CHC2 zinc finger domain-containing protein [Methylococcales bacterium]|nr:CHC2 zinc finger domain-containing protein [Methylococcales bacterium]MDP3839530.1 CHC2 zinc finger domain-containing protein [Methylococcales bacterium]